MDSSGGRTKPAQEERSKNRAATIISWLMGVRFAKEQLLDPDTFKVEIGSKQGFQTEYRPIFPTIRQIAGW